MSVFKYHLNEENLSEGQMTGWGWGGEKVTACRAMHVKPPNWWEHGALEEFRESHCDWWTEMPC